MYVCVYVYIYKYLYLRMYIYMCVYICTYIHIHTYIHVLISRTSAPLIWAGTEFHCAFPSGVDTRPTPVLTEGIRPFMPIPFIGEWLWLEGSCMVVSCMGDSGGMFCGICTSRIISVRNFRCIAFCQSSSCVCLCSSRLSGCWWLAWLGEPQPALCMAELLKVLRVLFAACGSACIAMTGESGTGGKYAQCGDALWCIGRTDAVVSVSSRVAHERGRALWKQCTTPVSACRYVFLGLTGVYSNKHIVEKKIIHQLV